MKSAVLSSRAPRVVGRFYGPSGRVPSSSRRCLRWTLRASTTLQILKKLNCPTLCASHSGLGSAASAEEMAANRRRWEESRNSKSTLDDWQWTLNWNEVSENIIIGSCPRSIEDVDCIAEASGATAILSVQSDLCLDALKIDYPALRDHGLSRGILMTRVPIRDFDHGDQTLMLPEAVRTLALLMALNFKVYVHCTAGINRATLTVLGYLTFVQGWDLYSALKKIQSARPQANPYIDCWKNVKTRLLEGRSEEVIALSRKFFLKNENGTQEDSFSNWVAAEDLVIKETFRRLLSSSVDTITALTDLKAESLCQVCINPDEMERANKEIENLQYELSIQRQRLAEATASLEAQRLEHLEQHAPPVHVTGPSETMNGNSLNAAPKTEHHPVGAPLVVFDELVRLKEEVAALRTCVRKIAMVSTEALSVDSMDSYKTEWEEEEEMEEEVGDVALGEYEDGSAAMEEVLDLQEEERNEDET